MCDTHTMNFRLKFGKLKPQLWKVLCESCGIHSGRSSAQLCYIIRQAHHSWGLPALNLATTLSSYLHSTAEIWNHNEAKVGRFAKSSFPFIEISWAKILKLNALPLPTLVHCAAVPLLVNYQLLEKFLWWRLSETLLRVYSNLSFRVIHCYIPLAG